MTDKLLKYYNNELSYLRKQGEQFSTKHPKVASKLRLGPGEIEDPFVGRLIESFAFLTANIQQKIDEQSQTINESLLSMLYPHYLLPIPAMSVVQFHGKEQLDKPFQIPVNTKIATDVNKDIDCIFSTSYATNLLPLNVDKITYSKDIPNYIAQKTSASQSCLSIKLKINTKDLDFSKLEMDKLRFYINAEPRFSYLIYELLMKHVNKITIRSITDKYQALSLPSNSITPVGLTDQESLLPYPAHSFSGYRLLTEYFSFANKFLFVEINNLSILNNIDGCNEVELYILFDRLCPDLENEINNKTLLLGCTPIINLFEINGDPIQIDDKKSEYPIIADAHKPIESLEVYKVNEITINSGSNREKIISAPYFGEKFNQIHHEKKLYWHIKRKPCWQLGQYHLNGYEHFISFSKFNIDDIQPLVITPKLLCSNRELPTLLPYGGDQPALYFKEKSYALVNKINCVTNITATKYRNLEKTTQSDLLAHIAHNQQTFSNNEQCLDMLKNILSLYHYQADNNTSLFEKGLIKATTKTITKRHPDHLKFGFCQGNQFQLTIDESYFPENSAYLFGCVLEVFLSKLSSINSFTQLALYSKQRGEIHTWPARLGIKQTL